MRTYVRIIAAMRRKAGQLVPLEETLCVGAADLHTRGFNQFHGYQLAKHLAARAEARLPTAYGTLYRALARLETMGLLESEWEDPAIAAQDQRPRRRLYRLTAAGRTTAHDLPRAVAARDVRRRTEPAPA